MKQIFTILLSKLRVLPMSAFTSIYNMILYLHLMLFNMNEKRHS